MPTATEPTVVGVGDDVEAVEPGPQFERNNLLREDEDLKRDFGKPSCCARLIAWRFTLLLLCNAVVILAVLGVQNRSALPPSVQNFINQTRSSLAPAPPRQPRPKRQEPAPATPAPPTVPPAAPAPPPAPAPPTPPTPPAPPPPAAPPAPMPPTKPLTPLPADSADPIQVPNATESSTPWVVYRFATRTPKICIQSTPPIHWERYGRMQKVLDLRREYARRHGYDYYSIALGGGNPMLTWTRSLQLLMDANTGCEYIFRMDSETLIVDFEFKLETLIHWKGMRDTDLVVAGTGITGALVTFTSCLWKTSPFSRRLLAELRHYMASSEPKATAAASMNAILGGCTERSTAGERKNCVKKVSKQEEALQREAVQTGNNTGIAEIAVNKSLLEHMKWLPMRRLFLKPEDVGFSYGEYKAGDKDVFLVHCPGIWGDRSIGKFLLFSLIQAGLSEAPIDPYETFRKDPMLIPNATYDTKPWVVHRFHQAGVSPHICMQCLMIPTINRGQNLGVLALQVEYARRRGYDLYTYIEDTFTKGGKSPLWLKIRSTQFLIDSGKTGCDYIFWMDSDTAIMNMSFKLESLIHWNGMPDTDVVVSGDTLAVNLAQSFWKFTRFSRDFLEDMWGIGRVPLLETGSINAILGGCQPDSTLAAKQLCYKHMDRGWREHKWAVEVYYPGDNEKIATQVVNKSLLQHMKWVPKNTINSYPNGLFWGTYKLGDPDFIVHCPSRKGKVWLAKFVAEGLARAGLAGR